GAAYGLLALPVPDSQRSFTAGSSPVWLGGVVYDASGRRLGMGLQNGTGQVWDADTAHEVLTVGSSHSGNEWSVLALAFSPDLARLATGGGDGLIKLWDATTGGELHTTASHQDLVLTVAFSPDGARLASGGADGSTKIWSLQALDWSPLVLPGQADAVSSVSFSPDG